MNGWLVKISGWDKPERVRLFAVAESDPREALVAVQNATDAAPALRVDTVGQLSADVLRALDLARGGTRDLTS